MCVWLKLGSRIELGADFEVAALLTKYKGPEMEKPVLRPYTPTSDEGMIPGSHLRKSFQLILGRCHRLH